LNIHETAIVHPKAELADDVEVGPYSIINEDVKIGRGTKIGPHVEIGRWTIIGEDCQFFFGCTIGNPSKDLKYGGWRSYAIIGDRNVFREYVSLSRATTEEGTTIVGNDNLIMNCVNIDHDCVVGNNVIMANLATLGGHVIVEDNCRIGAKTGYHQFVRVGKMSMSGACSYFSQDVPPFTLSTGNPAKVRGLNLIGLRTSKINPMRTLPPHTITLLKRAFRILFRSKLNMSQAIKKVRETIEPNKEVEYLLRFIEASKRGIGM
jgi:UDP-N-acetylglucosamine acyltransferase